MRLLLPQALVDQLLQALRRGGRKETGGVLMGEHVDAEVFRVVELTVQRAAGTTACFVRDPADHQAQLDAFLARHGHDYTRFNYLGEWHSHPLFRATPSDVDVRTMQSIVRDPRVGVNFAILMIVRLDWRGRLQISVAAFSAQAEPAEVDVEIEAPAGKCPPNSTILHRMRDLVRRLV